MVLPGTGLLVVTAFLLIALAVYATSCYGGSPREGFLNAPPYTQPTIKVPTVGPGAQSATGSKEPTKVTGISDLPSAPIIALGEANSLPFQDPAMEKATKKLINQMKQDMDGFSTYELPYMKERSDPAISIPLTRFQGDYQRIKDELRVLNENPGVQAQLTVDDVMSMGANLRFLQRSYRVFANNKMVPAPREELSSVGTEEGAEGFANPDDEPITPDQLNLLSQKLAVEIVRLQASGTTDPVLQARANMFTKIRQTIDDLNTRVKNGTLAAKDIPIKLKDYANFLPALGDKSAGIGGLLSKSGYSSLSSLFNAYDAGDVSGGDIAAALFEQYAESLLKGLSYTVNVQYTSPNEVSKKQAEATAWDAQRAIKLAGGAGSAGSLIDTGHPLTTQGARGQFDAQIRQLDLQGFQGGAGDGLGGGDNPRPPTNSPTPIGSFDWKARADAICLNVKRAGLNPADFGCLTKGDAVSSDYSWRGHTKMVCTRLATHSDPGTPEQMGCPPVGWRGWRT
jgi:hypothetical protein